MEAGVAEQPKGIVGVVGVTWAPSCIYTLQPQRGSAGPHLRPLDKHAVDKVLPLPPSLPCFESTGSDIQ